MMINPLISPLSALLNRVALTLFLLTSLLSTPSFAAEDWPPKQILCLHTERFPYTSGKKIFKKKHNTTIMSREITRQAFVIAATQELGIPVRDQSIGESWPTASDSEGIEVIHVAPLIRSIWGKKWQVRLYAVDPTQTDIEKLWDQKPLWKKTFRYDTGNTGGNFLTKEICDSSQKMGA